MNRLKRIWIWCKRIRNLNGFGVQSPFAFSFTHTVIYRKLPKRLQREICALLDDSSYLIQKKPPARVLTLFYKLTVYHNPISIIYIENMFTGGIYPFIKGCQCPVMLFSEECPMKSFNQPHPDMPPLRFSTGNIKENLCRYFQTHASVDMAYLDLNITNVAEVYEDLLRRCRQNSVMIVGNIYENASNKTLWKHMTEDKHTFLTFDLYEVGIILFDRHFYPHHYIINFEG